MILCNVVYIPRLFRHTDVLTAYYRVIASICGALVCVVSVRQYWKLFICSATLFHFPAKCVFVYWHTQTQKEASEFIQTSVLTWICKVHSSNLRILTIQTSDSYVNFFWPSRQMPEQYLEIGNWCFLRNHFNISDVIVWGETNHIILQQNEILWWKCSETNPS
jgi:hypothetical protein